MHPVIDRIIEQAKKQQKTIILPEAEDERMLRAARKAVDEKVARIILCGDERRIKKRAEEFNISLRDIQLVNILSHPRKGEFIEKYYESRKSKGDSRDEAKKTILNPLFFAAKMAKNNEADGVVAGAVNTTANVLRAVIRIIRPHPDIHTISSFFLMICPGHGTEEERILLYADCASIPAPGSTKLAEIAVSSADSFRYLIGKEPRVAMLSFSTYGSSEHAHAEKIIRATRKAKKLRPDLCLDGELQADAALVPSVAEKKAPGSPVKGRANVLIFPDLNSGNIAYKLTERLAGAQALGPILQGANLPMNDLSRGCSVDDIFLVTAITAIQAQA